MSHVGVDVQKKFSCILVCKIYCCSSAPAVFSMVVCQINKIIIKFTQLQERGLQLMTMRNCLSNGCWWLPKEDQLCSCEAPCFYSGSLLEQLYMIDSSKFSLFNLYLVAPTWFTSLPIPFPLICCPFETKGLLTKILKCVFLPVS